MAPLSRKQKIYSVIGAIALAASGGGIALAAIPDSADSEFHACVANTGPVRAVYMIDKDASESCAAGYTEKVWPGVATDVPHVKVIKKTVLSGGSGGSFGDTWACPTGYIATAVTWKVTPSSPQGVNDVDVWVTDNRVNPNENNAAEFRFMAHSRTINGTSGQVSVEVRGTCVSEVVSDGVATS